MVQAGPGFTRKLVVRPAVDRRLPGRAANLPEQAAGRLRIARINHPHAGEVGQKKSGGRRAATARRSGPLAVSHSRGWRGCRSQDAPRTTRSAAEG